MMKKVSIIAFIITLSLSQPIAVLASGLTNEAPVLNAYVDGEKVKLEWAVEMPSEDVLYQTGFEVGDLLPNLNYGISVNYLPDNRKYGGQSFAIDDKFSGNRSLKIVDSYNNGNVVTIDLNGNWYTTSDYSWADFNHQPFYIPNGTDLSLSFRAKTTGSGSVLLRGIGGKADQGEPLNITFLQDVKVGDKTVKVSDVNFFKNYVDKGTRYHLALSKGTYNYGWVTGYNVANSTITLNTGFQGPFKKGDNVLRHINRNPVNFSNREIKADDGWKLFNVNTKVAEYPDYNTLNRGFYLTIQTLTHDIVYIDDLKVGYATRTQLLRDGKIIYDGYLSDFEDKEATDKGKPDVVSAYNVLNEGNHTYISFKKPSDFGSSYEYELRAINRNGNVVSNTNEVIEIISGTKGFSYIIDNNPNTIPDGSIQSLSGKIEIPKNIDGKTYLHIAAVDNAGNMSDVSHYFVNKNGLSTTNITPSTTEWTNKNVMLEIETINGGKIALPNGTIVQSNRTTYMATENGIYTFLVLDEKDTIIDIASYDVKNIDRERKEVLIIPSDEKWRNKDIEVRIKSK